MNFKNFLSIADFRKAARLRLPRGIFAYVDGGSDDQSSLAANMDAFSKWSFLTRPLTNVTNRNQAVTIFGAQYKSPFGISPMGFAGLCSYDGDRALAEAASDAGIPGVLSAASTTPMESVLKHAPNTWYQAYIPGNVEIISPLLERLKKASIKVLVITVDVPVQSVREYELRNDFTVPFHLTLRLMISGIARPRWLAQTFFRTLIKQGIPHFENFTASRGGRIISGEQADRRIGRTALTWEEIRWIRKNWHGSLVIKGILRPEDAVTAQALGVDGVIVSNHGGRQLDGALASLNALSGIVKAAPNLVVMMDGGIRRGTDVLKALSLGAKLVFIGRPAMYGLAVNGKSGVAHAIKLISTEIDTNLALLGCPDVGLLDESYIIPSP